MASVENLKLPPKIYHQKTKIGVLSPKHTEGHPYQNEYWSGIESMNLDNVIRRREKQSWRNSLGRSTQSTPQQNQLNIRQFVEKQRDNGLKQSRQQMMKKADSTVRQLSQQNRLKSKQKIKSQQTYFRYRIKMLALLRLFNLKNQQVQKLQQLSAQQFIQYFVKKIKTGYKLVQNQLNQLKSKHSALSQTIKFKDEYTNNLKIKSKQKQKMAINLQEKLMAQLRQHKASLVNREKQIDQLKIELCNLKNKIQIQQQNNKIASILQQKHKLQNNAQLNEEEKKRLNKQDKTSQKSQNFEHKQQYTVDGKIRKQIIIQSRKTDQKYDKQKKYDSTELIKRCRQIQQQCDIKQIQINTILNLLNKKIQQYQQLSIKFDKLQQKYQEQRQFIDNILERLQVSKQLDIRDSNFNNLVHSRRVQNFNGQQYQKKGYKRQREKRYSLKLDKKQKSRDNSIMNNMQQKQIFRQLYQDREISEIGSKVQSISSKNLTAQINVGNSSTNIDISKNNIKKNDINRESNKYLGSKLKHKYSIQNQIRITNYTNSIRSSNINMSNKIYNSQIDNDTEILHKNNLQNKLDTNKEEGQLLSNILSKQQMIQRVANIIQQWKNRMYSTVNEYQDMIQHYNQAIFKKNQEIKSLRRIANKFNISATLIQF